MKLMYMYVFNWWFGTLVKKNKKLLHVYRFDLLWEGKYYIVSTFSLCIHSMHRNNYTVLTIYLQTLHVREKHLFVGMAIDTAFVIYFFLHHFSL